MDSDHARVYPKVGLLLDGDWVYDRQPCHRVINPSTEEALGPVPGASAADLDRALEAAQRGFDVWRKESPARRSELLHRTAALLRSRVEQIAPVITLEQGKPLADSRAEVLRAASFLDWDAEALLRMYGRSIPSESSVQQLVLREPVGPVAAFTPWNVPISAPARKLSASLAAGCSVIIKPAEETPATTCLFAQCFLDSGLPQGVLSVVFGQPAEVSTRLISSPVIRMVTLTGSVQVGKQLSQLAAQGLKPTVMELGGHAPVLIDAGVDPGAVAQAAAAAKFRMAGQICASPTRFLVHKSIYEPFVEALAEAAHALQVGDGFAAGVKMGPLINARRLSAMSSLVDNAVRLGAKVVTGGQRIGDRGWFYAPTVLAGVPLEADIMSIEPFGPIAPCRAIADLDEGLQIANSLPVGLQGFVFTNSVERADQLERELQVGVISTNSFMFTGADAPFGGVKESGSGREGGEESVTSYTLTKTVMRRSGRL